MAFWPCRQDDEFVKLVRQRYGATVVKNPRTGIDPCDVLARGSRGSVRRVGDLLPLLDAHRLVLPQVKTEYVAALAGKSSSDVDLGIGVSLTSSFFQAIGVPIPEAELELRWRGARTLAFEFKEVRLKEVDVSTLGARLEGRSVRRDQPAAASFFKSKDGGGEDLLLITHCYVTSSFAVTAKRSRDAGFALSASAIDELIGNAKANVKVNQDSENTLSFDGNRAVTFAFGAVACTLSGNGEILEVGPEVDPATSLNVPDVPGADLFKPYGALFQSDGLLEIED